MSVQCSVTCLDCPDYAPPVGDGGFVGAPSLDPGEWPDQGFGGPMPAFGVLHDALRAVHISTYELDAFREWLDRHRGHRVILSSDHDAEFPPELLALWEQWATVAHKREMVARQQQRRGAEAAAQADGSYQMGIYTARCGRCEEEVASPEPELLRAFGATTLAVAEIDSYLQQWGPAGKGRDTTWRLMSPVVDPNEPFVPELGQFFERHKDHAISIALVGGD